jgi:hypothetical protein
LIFDEKTFDESTFEFDEVVKKLQIDENSSQTSLKIKKKKIIFSLISIWDFFLLKERATSKFKKTQFFTFFCQTSHTKERRKKFWKP